MKKVIKLHKRSFRQLMMKGTVEGIKNANECEYSRSMLSAILFPVGSFRRIRTSRTGYVCLWGMPHGPILALDETRRGCVGNSALVD